MESVGERLKNKRLEKGISLQDAHKKTKIHLDILKSIEDDSFVNLNPVYIKGFLKIYCQFLGVDPAEYISSQKPRQDVNESSVDKAKTPTFLKPIANRGHPVVLKTIFVIIALIVLLFLSIGLLNLTKKVYSKISSANRLPRTRSKAVPKQVKKLTPAKPKVQQALRPQIQTQPSQPMPVQGKEDEFEIRIGINAVDDCWIQLKVDGKTVFQNILKKGRFESWQAKEKIELSLGSSGAVQLEVNGKLIPPLGRRGQVLKNIVITKDGLKVGK